MGKNSLVKSTTKGKKSAAKKKDEEVTAKTTTKATTKKAASKAKTAPKTKTTPKGKAAPKAKKAASAKVKKAAPKAKKKKVSVKDLLQKKFPVWKPEKVYTVSPDQADDKDFSAPPFASGTEEEKRRIRELLLKKFDLAEIKAAAERAAAEKASVETAAAEPEVSVSYEPPDNGDGIPADPMDKMVKYGVVAVVILIALVVGSSMMNNNKYYIHSTAGALEIWQGRFAPMGQELLIALPGAEQPEKIKDIYSKSGVFPLIFNYYIDKADTLLKVPGMPDFEGIKKYLNKALSFATTPTANEAVFGRLNHIKLMILLYKADVAASKATLSDLKEAKQYLSEAERLDIDDMQIDLIHQKIDAVDEHIESLKAEKTEAKSPAKPAE